MIRIHSIYFFLTALAFYCVQFTPHLWGLQHGVFAKCEGEVTGPFSVYSERCSGSNYLTCLIQENLEIENCQLSHKHFPPWFTIPLAKWRGNPMEYTFEGTESWLFVIIVRNPYDWALSLHKKPHHASANLLRKSFSQFIRTSWGINPNDPVIKPLIVGNPLIDRDPISEKPFANVFQLRRSKLLNMLHICQKAKNVYLVRYEEARDYPKEVLEEIAQTFHLTMRPVFDPIDYYKGDENQGIYQGSNYSPISRYDLNYIDSQLDWEIESLFGYPRADHRR